MSNKSITRIKWAFWSSLAIFALMGCKTNEPKGIQLVSNKYEIASGKPQISQLLDLGVDDLALDQPLPTPESDGLFHPGEWILVKGKNLGTPQVSIDNLQVPIHYFYKSQPIFQLPRGLKPLQKHELIITQTTGNASIEFASTHYIITTDTDDHTTYLISTNPNEKAGIDKDWGKLDNNFTRPIFNLISHSGQFLYCFNIREDAAQHVAEQKGYWMQVATYNLSAPGKPKELSRFEFLIESAPTDAIINENNQIAVLGRQNLLLLDATNPKHLSLMASQQLVANPKGSTYYADAIFLQNNTHIAALEAQSNNVSLFDIQNTGVIKPLNSLQLLPGKSLPFSVDLEPDASDSNRFWVLQAPNFRMIDSRLIKGAYQKFIHQKPTPPDEQPVYQVQNILVSEDHLTIEKAIPLPPDFAAYFLHSGLDGRLYISSSKMTLGARDFAKSDKDSLFKQARGVLWDSIAFGRILGLDPMTGDIETVASGVGIYYHLVDVPDFGPIFTLSRFTPSMKFPFLIPTWGIGIKRNGTYGKRKMSVNALYPPYSLGYIAFQY